MKTASILAVGTEITSGEILNRNSTWIAARLEELGIPIRWMQSVPDDRELILKALKHLASESPFLFVTGGLGPTTDDFTRDVIAQFVGQTLCFREESWQRLIDIYQNRGLPLREAHRQQCQFPEGARVLANPVGTAEGFLVEGGGVRIFALPGPPREVEGVFNQDILPILQGLSIERTTALTKIICLGAPESEVAEIVEEVMRGQPVTLGYRASFPYVHVKVWHPIGETPWLGTLRERLKTWEVGEGAFDMAVQWLDTLKDLKKVRIVDEATGGRLAQRLETLTREREMKELEIEVITYFSSLSLRSRGTYREPVDGVFSVHLKGQSHQYRVSANLEGQAISKTLEIPYRIPPTSERGRIYMAEHALCTWFEFMRQTARGGKV